MVRIDVDRICRGKEPQPWSRLPIAQNTEIELAIREALDYLACESLIRGKLIASLRQAIEAFTSAAYSERLTFAPLA